MKRIEREKLVIGDMIALYCRKHHGIDNGMLCDECVQLLSYARHRLDLCPHGDRKPSCRKCEIHCYSREKRELIRAVMRYVGPRMLFIHPLTALRHLIYELK